MGLAMRATWEEIGQGGFGPDGKCNGEENRMMIMMMTAIMPLIAMMMLVAMAAVRTGKQSAVQACWQAAVKTGTQLAAQVAMPVTSSSLLVNHVAQEAVTR